MATKRQIADLNASVTLYAKQYIDEMVRVGKITQTTSRGINRDMKRVGQSTNSLNLIQQRGSKNASRYGVVMQQAGYQVQDFAVQVAAGQSALVAFGQQGSQILGVFGPAGAIAGAALGVGVLATQLIGLAASAKTAKRDVGSFADELKALYEQREARFFATASLPEQIRGYGSKIEQAQAELNQSIDKSGINAILSGDIRPGGPGIGGLGLNYIAPDLFSFIFGQKSEAAAAEVAQVTKELENLGNKRDDLIDDKSATDAKALTERVKGMMKDLADYAEEQNQASEQIRKAQEQRVAAYKKEGEALMNSVRTAQERYNEELAEWQRRLADGNITQETYNRLVERSAAALDKAAGSSRKLRTEILSISEIANAGGGSANASKARRALDIRERAKEAEARGNFSYADKLYAQAESVEGRIKRRERTFDAETGAPAGTTTGSTGAPPAPTAPSTPGESNSVISVLQTIHQEIAGLKDAVAVA